MRVSRFSCHSKQKTTNQSDSTIFPQQDPAKDKTDSSWNRFSWKEIEQKAKGQIQKEQNDKKYYDAA
jgi:hypothetical protein